MTDPRAANCRAYHLNAAGRVDGIHLIWEPVPSAPYACVLAELIDEEAAMGNTVVTVEILNRDGIQTAERALMAWPYGEPPAADAPAGPGNTNNQFTTTSTFPSTRNGVEVIGPLGFFVGNAAKQAISDVIWGYGLPDHRHVSGHVVFKERAGAVTPPVEPPNYATLAAALRGEAEAHDVLAVNPAAALCKYGARLGLWPTSNEFTFTFGGVNYVAQRFRDPGNDDVHVLSCVVGQYGVIGRLTYRP